MNENITKLKLNDFKILQTIGTGSFGRVKIIQKLTDGSYWALKIMKKSEILKLK